MIQLEFAWGEQVAQEIDEKGWDNAEEFADGKGMIQIYTFNTKAEKDAFLLGVVEGADWFGYTYRELHNEKTIQTT